MADGLELLRLGEAAAQLGWSRGRMRHLVDVGRVEVGGQEYPLRSVQAGDGRRPGQRQVRADDVAAVRAAIDAAIR